MTLPPPGKRHRSFAAHWLILCGTLLFLAIQMGVDLFNTRDLLEHEARQRLTNHGRVLTAALDQRLHSINAVLLHLREMAPMARKQGGEALMREMSTLVKTIPGVRTLAIFDAKGGVIASSRQEILGNNYAYRDYFKTLQQQPQPDRLHMSAPFITIMGVYTLILARPIYSAPGEFSGIVTATLDTDDLFDLLKSLHADAGTRLSVVHGNGTLLRILPEQPEIGPGFNTNQPGSIVHRHLDSGKQRNFLEGLSAVRGTDSIAYLQTLQPAALGIDTALIAVAARDRDSILTTWNHQRQQRVILFAGFSLLCILALILYQQRQRHFEQQLERKEDERERSRLALQRFIDHLPGTAYVKDGESRTLMASRGFQTLLGMDPQAMIGKTSAELFPGTFGQKVVADDQRVLANGLTEVIEESFNGRDYESTKFVIDTGSSEHWLGGMTIDITPRKETERLLAQQMAHLQELNQKFEAAQNQLLQSEKMASLGQLAAGVAHELNNPIGFVYSNLGTLDRYLKDIFEIASICEQAASKAGNPKDFANIEAIKREKDFEFIRTDIFQLMAESKDGLERVRKIVQDLKDFSRPGETEWQWADLHAGLDSTLNIVWNELKYKCNVKKLYGDLPQVWCLPPQINQVFMNLLVNAAHAIPDRGEITIATGQQDNQAFVAIADTGAGISPENLKRIFEPFFTTKPVGQGTGLGLSLVWSIVEKHHGRIDVESEPGKGSTFTVWLPIEPPRPEQQ
jgi:PAS domain S-box-containing protein